jgi:hypothetical protein
MIFHVDRHRNPIVSYPLRSRELADTCATATIARRIAMIDHEGDGVGW